MKNTINQTSNIQFHAIIAKIFPELKQLKAQENKTVFNKLMENILPDIERYIARELRRALKNKSIPSGKYNVADFVDELYIMAYDHFNEVKEEKHLHSWLFKKADRLLEDTIIEEEFDHTFYENIEHFSKLEWDEMEEKFSMDADGDLVMEEEFDDLSYPKNNYILENVFVEDKQEDIIEKLDEDLTAERIYKHIAMVLEHLPFPIRTIFDLTVNQQFKPAEIADIKKISVQEVNQYLTHARRYIRISLENRYLLSKN